MKKLVEITDRPIQVSEVDDWIWDPSCGGEVRFLGRVRDNNNNKVVESIKYSAYPEMALKEINHILDDATKKWPLKRCAVVHRTGHLRIGEVAVAVYATSIHREESFEACQYVINEVKKRVPIWKKEIYTDGSEWVGQQCQHK